MVRRDYVRNNIYFRIIACKALETYKNTQAFVLGDITNGKHKFSETPRELMLLMFDNWFRYLLFLERFSLSKHEPFTADDIERITIEAQVTIDTITEIALSNTDVFDNRFISIWRQTHKALDEYLFLSIAELAGQTNTNVFPNIVKSLSKCLNASLLELHEIDCLVYKQQMFVSFDPVCLEYDTKTNKVMLVDRYKIYDRYIHTDLNVKVYVEENSKELCEQHCIQPLLSAGASIKTVEY